MGALAAAVRSRTHVMGKGPCFESSCSCSAFVFGDASTGACVCGHSSLRHANFTDSIAAIQLLARPSIPHVSGVGRCNACSTCTGWSPGGAGGNCVCGHNGLLHGDSFVSVALPRISLTRAALTVPTVRLQSQLEKAA